MKDSWKDGLFGNFKLYAVTDLKTLTGEFYARVEEAYRGGADIVQLRSKSLTDAQLYAAGLRIRKIADRCRKLFIVNDRTDVALAVCADGVHLGQDDLPVAAARAAARGVRRPFWIGKSTHSREQAVAAEREGADYIGFGPVFGTPTKPGAPPVGTAPIRGVTDGVRIPVVCIGGIDLGNVAGVLNAGARRVAVVRAIFDAVKTLDAAQALRKKIEECDAEKK